MEAETQRYKMICQNITVDRLLIKHNSIPTWSWCFSKIWTLSITLPSNTFHIPAKYLPSLKSTLINSIEIKTFTIQESSIQNPNTLRDLIIKLLSN